MQASLAASVPPNHLGSLGAGLGKCKDRPLLDVNLRAVSRLYLKFTVWPMFSLGPVAAGCGEGCDCSESESAMKAGRTWPLVQAPWLTPFWLPQWTSALTHSGELDSGVSA